MRAVKRSQRAQKAPRTRQAKRRNAIDAARDSIALKRRLTVAKHMPREKPGARQLTFLAANRLKCYNSPVQQTEQQALSNACLQAVATLRLRTRFRIRKLDSFSPTPSYSASLRHSHVG
ncbi:hypothetical protein [Rubneribacter badeniensis]|uniref:hypothetical protein n=1 Tax=Rubneribacter badeniensis TaxID=2070688 RepID=UPI00101AE864|nr:hypothetical protein [Rubneribacter badeniensis]